MHYSEKITIDELSVLSGYSKTVFIQKFKKYYNATPISYMNQLRMKKAREYLINTNFSVSEISALCGFNCPYYFSNSFTKTYGESPLKYRNNRKI
jgi:AraC family L-rhamnose operon regulatory protein RhaS